MILYRVVFNIFSRENSCCAFEVVDQIAFCRIVKSSQQSLSLSCLTPTSVQTSKLQGHCKCLRNPIKVFSRPFQTFTSTQRCLKMQCKYLMTHLCCHRKNFFYINAQSMKERSFIPHLSFSPSAVNRNDVKKILVFMLST